MPTPSSSPFEEAVSELRAGRPAEEAAARLLQELTPTERLGLLDGDEDFWPGQSAMSTVGYNRTPYVFGAIERLGVPGLRFSDGPRGVVMGSSTAFPVPMARGATWDTALEERIGEVIGAEVRAQGGNFFAGVCVNLPRHPAWGRIQETYGEDPVLLGSMGTALARGVQRHVMACAKHYALNSMENARFTVDVRVDERALHEVYLPHFRRLVEEGVAGIMSAYNAVNGEWCGQHPVLLTEVLREEWGFDGVVISDFVFGLRDAAASLAAGLDVEAPFRQQRARFLPGDLADGRARWQDVDRSALRVLATQLRFAARFQGTDEPGPEVVACAEHRDLARVAAARSMVLLRNEPVDGRPVLPLDPAALRTLAVVGRLADLPNTGDHGSSDVRAPEVVTFLHGLRTALPETEVLYDSGEDPSAAARLAARADVAVVIVGYTAEDEGEYVSSDLFTDPALMRLLPPAPEGRDAEEEAEPAEAGAEPAATGTNLIGSFSTGGDRDRLTLRPEDEELILAVAGTNARTVVGVVAAGAVLTGRWRDRVPAHLMLWYAGMEGGHALADVLLGRCDATGRLPFSVPERLEHLPDFDRDARTATYDLWHGQRLLDRRGLRPAHPLGFGLSYTSFTLADARVAIRPAAAGDSEEAEVSVLVTNTGSRAGSHVVQVYAAREDGTADASVRVLLGFHRLDLPAGQARRIAFPVSLRPLRRRQRGSWAPLCGTFRVEAAAYCGDRGAATTRLVVSDAQDRSV